MAMLEPQAPDSLLHWGFASAIFERPDGPGAYITEPMARIMMANSPELKKEFEARVASDAGLRRRSRRASAVVVRAVEIRSSGYECVSGGPGLAKDVVSL